MVSNENFSKCVATILLRYPVMACSILISVMVFSFALTRSWSKDCLVQAGPNTHLQIKFVRPNGTEIVRKHNFTEKSPQRIFHSLRPVEVTAISDNARFRLGEKEYQLAKNESASIADWDSLRFRPYQLVSMGLFSVVVGFLVYFSLKNIPRLTDRLSATLVGLILTVVYGFTQPGIFLFDTYCYLEWGAASAPTEFVGVLYAFILTTLYQIFPNLWIVHLINFITVLYVSICILSDADSRKKKILFWLGFVVVMFYPANFNFNISSNRDVAAMWVLGYFLLYLLKHRFEITQLSRLPGFWFLLVFSCELRSEFLYVVMLFLPALLFRKKFQVFFACLTIVLCISFAKILIINPYVRDSYQATALINPLSYILVTKYPEGIPKTVDEQLGKYFKNNFLLKHYSEYEIDPYHAGGVNFDTTLDEYKKFRRTAIILFAENFSLFVKNRMKFFTAMFGFSDQKPMLGILVESKDRPYLQEILSRIGFEEEGALGENKIIKFISKDLVDYPVHVMSYSIAFLLLLLALFSVDKSFYLALGILLTRTAVVVITAPAPMYKYNFVIWVFACFSFIYIQRKNTISEPEL